jgi:hypothetical protein
MRRFSIQDPPTKGYHGEGLFYAVLRHLDVVAPRFGFVRVTLNGSDVGIMAYEEHFTKEMLEHCGRRESVIVRFDETLLFHGLDDYRTAPVRAFQDTRVAANPALRRDSEAATALLRGFVAGTLQPSQVFDAHELGGMLAAAELCGSMHALRWHNMRFYFDPTTGRLGPVGFDANWRGRSRVGDVVVAGEPIVSRMLDDPEIHRAFRRRLEALCLDVRSGALVDELRACESEWLPVLQKEFALLEGFNGTELRARAEFHLELTDEALRAPGVLADHPLLVRASLRGDGASTRIELVNAVPHDVDVHALRWADQSGDRTAPVIALATLPLRLAGQRRDGPPLATVLACEPPPGPTFTVLEIVAGMVGDERRQVDRAVAAPAPATAPLVPESSVAEQLRLHPFLRVDDDGRTLRLGPGTVRVTAALVVPPGCALVVAAGTHALFARRAALVAHGPVALAGTPALPVLLGGDEAAGDGTWLGVAVLRAPTASCWEHAEVRDTRSTELEGYALTGGVTFVRSEVALKHVRFLGHRGEDALNLVRAPFTLEDATFTGTASDSLDADFSDGRVARCQFSKIGGDAVDVSGSRVEVASCRFTDIGDKALSVGEGSTVVAADLTIERAGAGVVAKDGSRATIDRVAVTGARFASLAAYVKKTEYGAAVLRASHLQHAGEAPRARAQLGSEISVDGVPVTPEHIDVPALYETIMRK